MLVLGSLPGRRSLEAGEYYANAQNSFWKIMGRLLAEDLEVPYAARKRILIRSRIALWDVLASGHRQGSLDTAIVESSVQPNDFSTFLKVHPKVRLVCFNGQKAAGLYRRRVLPMLGDRFPQIRYATLPSTSPAHAAMSFDDKFAKWSIVREQLRQ